MSKRKEKSKHDIWQNIEYWIKKYPNKTIEECEGIRQEKLKGRKLNNPLFIEYWIKKYPDKTIEECEELLSQHKKEASWQNIEYWIKKYPNKTIEECEEMLRQKKKSATKKRPDNTGINNPAHRSKTTAQQRRERSVMCIEYWRKKYPEKSEIELQKLLNNKKQEVIQKIKDTPQTNQIRYWLAHGYSKEESQLKVSEAQRARAFTLEKCIKKYGEIEGRQIFEARQIKWQKSLHQSFQNTGKGITQSQLGNNIINQLKLHLPGLETEYLIGRYSFDIKLGKKLIEINGDYWHCNPEYYEPNFYNKTFKRRAFEIWAKDDRKRKTAEKLGYDVLVVWESQYNISPSEIIKKCLDFLTHD